MQLEIDQIDFQIIINSFQEEIFSKMDYMGRVQIQFLRKFENSVKVSESHAQMIHYIRNIIFHMQEVHKDVRGYFKDLKMGFVYDFFRKIHLIMVCGFNFISQALITHIDHQENQKENGKKEKQIHNLIKKKNNMISQLQPVKMLEKYDYAIDFLEKEEKKLSIEIAKIYQNFINEKPLIQSLEPSKASKCLEQIKYQSQISLENAEKIFEETYQIKYLQFKQYLNKLQKAESITTQYCNNISKATKEKFKISMMKTSHDLYQQQKNKYFDSLVQSDTQTQEEIFESMNKTSKKEKAPKFGQKLQTLLVKQKKNTQKLSCQNQLLRKSNKKLTESNEIFLKRNKFLEEKFQESTTKFDFLSQVNQQKRQQIRRLTKIIEDQNESYQKLLEFNKSNRTQVSEIAIQVEIIPDVFSIQTQTFFHQQDAIKYLKNHIQVLKQKNSELFETNNLYSSRLNTIFEKKRNYFGLCQKTSQFKINIQNSVNNSEKDVMIQKTQLNQFNNEDNQKEQKPKNKQSIYKEISKKPSKINFQMNSDQREDQPQKISLQNIIVEDKSEEQQNQTRKIFHIIKQQIEEHKTTKIQDKDIFKSNFKQTRKTYQQKLQNLLDNKVSQKDTISEEQQFNQDVGQIAEENSLKKNQNKNSVRISKYNGFSIQFEKKYKEKIQNKEKLFSVNVDIGFQTDFIDQCKRQEKFIQTDDLELNSIYFNQNGCNKEKNNNFDSNILSQRKIQLEKRVYPSDKFSKTIRQKNTVHIRIPKATKQSKRKIENCHTFSHQFNSKIIFEEDQGNIKENSEKKISKEMKNTFDSLNFIKYNRQNPLQNHRNVSQVQLLNKIIQNTKSKRIETPNKKGERQYKNKFFGSRSNQSVLISIDKLLIQEKGMKNFKNISSVIQDSKLEAKK